MSADPTSDGAEAPVVLVVMRHGERHDVVNGIDEGDTVLTPQGVADVAGAATRLGDVLRADRRLSSAAVAAPHIVSSPFRRTIQTAVALRDSWASQVCTPSAADELSTWKPPRITLDPRIGEVFGPQRIKVALPPVLDGWQEDLPDAIVPESGGLEPAEWGEDAPAAHARLAASFRRHVAEQRALGGGVRVLVTHGDALQAIVAAVRPGKVVYDCAYLGFAVLRQRRPGGPWRVVGLDGIMTFDENDDGTPSSEEPGTPCVSNGGASASPYGSPGGDADPPPSSTSEAGDAVPSSADHTSIVVEIVDDRASPRRVVKADLAGASPGTAQTPSGTAADASPYGGTRDCDDALPPPQYSAPRPEEGVRYRGSSSATSEAAADVEEAEMFDVERRVQYAAPLPVAVAALAAPKLLTSISFAALKPQRVLPATLMVTTVAVGTLAAAALTVAIRRSRARNNEATFALVGARKESATNAVARLAITRRQGRLALCWLALSAVLCAACVALAAAVAAAIDTATDASVLTSRAVWTNAAWLIQWALVLVLDALAAFLTPL